MSIKPQDYSVYLYHVGDGNYQLFIKNVSADADFIRVITGYTQMTHGKRTGTIMNQWIITPLRPDNEHVHIGDIAKQSYKAQRLWIAFEAVKRGKKNMVVGTFIALSPRPSTWRTKTGALSCFDLQLVDSIGVSLYEHIYTILPMKQVKRKIIIRDRMTVKSDHIKVPRQRRNRDS